MGDAHTDPDGYTVTACRRCPKLVESRSQIVNGVGPADADVLFVGEAPGASEDARGEPFVGRSGAVLDDALEAAGLDRNAIRITNCVRCRPPENRNPASAELDNCRGYLEAEIAQVDPAVIVTLGKVPGEHLLDRSLAVTKETGTVEMVRFDPEASPRRVLICLHPAATLYDRSQESAFFETVREAARMAGVSSPNGGQRGLEEF